MNCQKCGSENVSTERRIDGMRTCDDYGKPASTYSGKYDEARIACELHLTASGQSYYGNALYVALDIPCIMASPEHKTAIQRYLRGTQSATDHIRLQEAAMMIASNAQAHSQAAQGETP